MTSQSVMLTELSERIKQFKAKLMALEVSDTEITHQPAPGKWSADECFKHLVVMWQTYKPQFERGIQKAAKKKTDHYKSTWFGKWFANRMRPIQKKGAMPTVPIFEPVNYTSEFQSIKRLVEVQDEMISYADLLADVDLNTKIQSPANRFIRFKLGDALLVLVNHQDRHYEQAMRAIESAR